MATQTAPKPRPSGKPAATPPVKPEGAETATATCGVVFERKTPQGKVKDYACTKDKGHEGKHGLARREALPEVSLSVLDSLEDVPETEKLPVRAETGTRERSAEQKAVDGHVAQVHAEWIAAGKPSAFNDSPRKRYMFEPGQSENILSMLRRAERLHGIRVRALPVKRHESGKEMLYWTVTDKHERQNQS